MAKGHGRDEKRCAARKRHRAVILSVTQQPQDEPTISAADDKTGMMGEANIGITTWLMMPTRTIVPDRSQRPPYANESVRGGRWETEPPGDEVPDTALQQRGQDDDQAFAAFPGSGDSCSRKLRRCPCRGLRRRCLIMAPMIAHRCGHESAARGVHARASTPRSRSRSLRRGSRL